MRPAATCDQREARFPLPRSGQGEVAALRASDAGSAHPAGAAWQGVAVKDLGAVPPDGLELGPESDHVVDIQADADLLASACCGGSHKREDLLAVASEAYRGSPRRGTPWHHLRLVGRASSLYHVVRPPKELRGFSALRIALQHPRARYCKLAAVERLRRQDHAWPTKSGTSGWRGGV